MQNANTTHADTRVEAGFGILPMMTEYRALRAKHDFLTLCKTPAAASKTRRITSEPEGRVCARLCETRRAETR